MSLESLPEALNLVVWQVSIWLVESKLIFSFFFFFDSLLAADSFPAYPKRKLNLE